MATPETTAAASRRPHAIALFSGGLDSALAVLLLLEQNIQVTALTFMTAFGCDLSDRSSCGHNPFPAAERFGFRVKLMNLGSDYIDMVRHPRFGYGKNMNPCVDCRIMMLSQAKSYMELAQADFVVTGEVMNQRRFSQVKGKLLLTERAAGLEGLLLRPLSAQLLPPTVPEERGWVDRSRLMGIRGRSRKQQMELAKRLGLESYPNPASGCLLTDPGYSARLKDLFLYTEHVDLVDLNLLRTGRQFRLSERVKAIVGRNEVDNGRIESNTGPADIRMEVPGAGSPLTLLRGEPDAANLRLAAEITACYSSQRSRPLVHVEVRTGETVESLTVVPASEEKCSRYRITADAPSVILAYSAE